MEDHQQLWLGSAQIFMVAVRAKTQCLLCSESFSARSVWWPDRAKTQYLLCIEPCTTQSLWWPDRAKTQCLLCGE